MTLPTYYLYEGKVTSVSAPLDFKNDKAMVVTMDGEGEPLYVRYPDFTKEAITNLEGNEANFLCIKKNTRDGRYLLCEAAAEQPNGVFPGLNE